MLNANRNECVFAFMCTLVGVLAVLANLTFKKFVHIEVFSYAFEISVGVLPFPIIFVCNDTINECFGRKAARTCVNIAVLADIIVAVCLLIFDSLPTTTWSEVSAAEFHKVFGSYVLNSIVSISVFYIAQVTDLQVFVFIKNLTGKKMLWLRANVSTAVALLVDTGLIVIALSVLRVITPVAPMTLVLHSYMFKITSSVLATPLFYGLTHWVKWYTVAPQERAQIA